MQVEYVKLGSWLTVRHYGSLIISEEIEPIYFKGLTNKERIESSRIDYGRQVRISKTIVHLTKVGEHESAEAGLARSKLKLFYKATVWESQTDKLVTNFMVDHGDGNKEQVTRLQAEIFSYVVYNSLFIERDRRRIARIKDWFTHLSAEVRNRPIEVKPKDIGLLTTVDAYNFLLHYEPIWEEFVKFIPGRIVIVT